MKIPANLTPITPSQLVDKSARAKQPVDTRGPRFSDEIKNLLYAVNDKQGLANNMVQDVVKGESDDLHGAMIALEEASVSFQLMLEVRNKMLDAYQEINRMNI